MSPLEIVLILIGAGIILFSCFLVDKSPVQKEALSGDGKELPGPKLTEEEESKLRDKIDSIVTDAVQDTVNRTEDELSRMSNEKIIAVDDFSNQVIEKISQNHEEVVFLYNMLNEKENEIKKTISQIDDTHEKLKTGSQENKTEPETVPGNTGSVRNENALNQSKQVIKRVPLEPGENNNQKILELYEQGNSIMEISKSLELGQGEVKLVIDLFKGK